MRPRLPLLFRARRRRPRSSRVAALALFVATAPAFVVAGEVRAEETTTATGAVGKASAADDAAKPGGGGAAEPGVARRDGEAEASRESATNADAAASLSPIVVDAEKPEPEKALVERSFDTPDDVTGFGETIFAEPTWRSFQSPAELLGQSVGAQLKRQGGREDFSSLSIRGAPSAQVRILLDGIALGRASDGVVNLADLPMDTVDRIEVYRGFAPVGLTPSSAAGVVNIITRDPKQATGSAAAGGGSFGSAKANASAAGPVAGGSASAFVAYRHTKGDFDYVDDNGTVFNPTDDQTRKRSNNESDAVENLLRWRGDVFDDKRLQLRNHVFYKDEGVPGLSNFSPPKARLETIREIAAAGFGRADDRWSVDEGVTWQRKRLSNYGSSFDNSGETTASSTTARWGRPVTKAHWFSGSSNYTWEGYDENNVSLPTQSATRSSLAIAGGDDWTVAPLNTTLSFQLRYQQLWDGQSTTLDSSSSSAHSTDPRVGLRWEALPGLSIKANASSYFRPPTFDELFGFDGFNVGNPLLKPEQGIAFDAGFEWKVEDPTFGKAALGYSWFGSEIDNIILIEQTFRRDSQARNSSKARIRGHEVRLEWQGRWGLALSSNYTWQQVENRSDNPLLKGKDLPGLPPQEAWGRLSWTRGSLVLAYDVSVDSAHYGDSENLFPKIPTRVVHDLSVVIGPLWKGFRLTFEADNLGNTLVPDDIGFPLPGRSFFAILSWSAAAEGSHDRDH